MLNPTRSANYADVLPDWTEAEFVEYIEDFFGVCINVDTTKNECSIDKFENKLSGACNYIKEVLKKTELTLDSDNTIAKKDYTNPEYDLPSSSNLAFEKLNNNVLSTAFKSTSPNYATLISNSGSQVKNLYDGNSVPPGGVLFYVSDIDTYYIPRKCSLTINTRKDGQTNDIYYFAPCNRFRNIYPDSDSTLSLKITPAEFNFNRYIADFGGSDNAFDLIPIGIPYQFPICNNGFSSSKGLNDIIVSGANNYHPERIEIVLNAGVRSVTDKASAGTAGYYQHDMLFTYTDSEDMLKSWNDPTLGWQFSVPAGQFFSLRSAMFTDTLRIAGYKGLKNTWYTDRVINPKKKYEIYFLAQDVDITAPFIINGKKFICEALEDTIDINGIKDNLVKGTFYPLS